MAESRKARAEEIQTCSGSKKKANQRIEDDRFGGFDLHFYRANHDLLFTAKVNVVILAFLLVVIVEGERLPNSENWLFANLLTCNSAAHLRREWRDLTKSKTGITKRDLSVLHSPNSL